MLGLGGGGEKYISLRIIYMFHYTMNSGNLGKIWKTQGISSHKISTHHDFLFSLKYVAPKQVQTIGYISHVIDKL